MKAAEEKKIGAAGLKRMTTTKQNSDNLRQSIIEEDYIEDAIKE